MQYVELFEGKAKVQINYQETKVSFISTLIIKINFASRSFFNNMHFIQNFVSFCLKLCNLNSETKLIIISKNTRDIQKSLILND